MFYRWPYSSYAKTEAKMARIQKIISAKFHTTKKTIWYIAL